jgi:cytochrome b6-f complex iron-sulfur subunit
MGRLSLWPAILGIALAMIAVTLIEPVPHSIGYASGVLVIISLLGWVVEARAVAGPPPAVEPEHEEEEEAPGPSYWPVILALGIVGIAAGLVYEFEEGALVVAVPLALWSGAAWAGVLKEEMMPAGGEEEEFRPRPLVTSGGRVLMPVEPNMLASQAAGGAVIALERVEQREISRRGLLRITFWTGMGAGLLAMAGSIVDFLYPRGITGFGSVVSAGLVEEFPPGTKTEVSEGKFWLVNLTEEQGGPGFLALWWKCPHLGCTVPWRENFSFVNPQTGVSSQGWFRCPCHGSTYNHAGVRVFGPAPRSMDRMEITIEGGRISVNTGSISKGTEDNASFAVQA